ncbi:hypothetical protein OZ410_11860 [Robiginitalea sp. M366]|uniref:hypothetical protein n=1 Tax=Robiginitalea aestuariiviva TaxID=3036903 RepID=UPI00240DD4FE|nr:hypothetical protein [Robiginitalea aestuariiviva]MDG1573015.1 hypothetical protein [Robiginitalea aestuariiviva]
MKTKVILWSLAGLLCWTQPLSAQDIPSASWQIETALMAVPADYRASARVLGYNPSGELVTLKQGDGPYIALADDPANPRFSTAAYHKELEPFMARGRALRAEGKTAPEVFDIREAEVKAGTLPMPDKATLCILTGEVEAGTGKILNPFTRYVFYIPYATGATTGLPTTPAPPGHAWIMDPGTHRAHIMITPPKQ